MRKLARICSNPTLFPTDKNRRGESANANEEKKPSLDSAVNFLKMPNWVTV